MQEEIKGDTVSKEVLAFTANLIVATCAAKPCTPEADRPHSGPATAAGCLHV